MGIFDKLKKGLKNTKDSSLKVYTRALRRLYRIIDRKNDEVPDTNGWLNDSKLKKKYESLSVNIRRHLSSAAHIYHKAVGKEDKYWKDRMFTDQNDYKIHRKKNNKSAKEEKLWIEDGLKKMKQASSEFKRRISSKLRKTPDESNLWLYTQYLILRFYSEIQIRNGLATVELKPKEKNNYLKKIKGSRYRLFMRTFKASERIGDRQIEISAALSRVLANYIKFRAKVDLEHDYLLSNSAGQVLSKPALGKILRKLTGDMLGKGIGTRMLRIFNATKNAKILEKADEVSNNMLHTSKQSKEYVRK